MTEKQKRDAIVANTLREMEGAKIEADDEPVRATFERPKGPADVLARHIRAREGKRDD